VTNEPDIRIDAPMFLARYREREAARVLDEGDGDDTSDVTDESLPLYLRQHRRRRAEPMRSTTPLWQRASLPMQRALTEDGRNKEISAPPEARRGLANDVFLIRHAETQGYSTDSGLTPQGAWQAHTYGHTLAKRIANDETVVLRHADTNRARETAEHIERGLRDGLEQFEKTITIHPPEAMDEFRNFQFVSPDGLKDVTAAFREYYAVREQYERLSTGDRPLWLVEIDRFWKLQVAGADPIEKWLTTPMLHFEPPSMTVRRFWVGINRLANDFPGARLIIPTHSGCIRAFAVAALGYDPGEPYNVEHVRVKIMEGRTDALVSYRNRVQELCVPSIDTLPIWNTVETWQPPPNATHSSTTPSTGAPS
jgi:broad specificity phosphatase PhoE